MEQEHEEAFTQGFNTGYWYGTFVTLTGAVFVIAISWGLGIVAFLG